MVAEKLTSWLDAGGLFSKGESCDMHWDSFWGMSAWIELLHVIC